jgi:alkylmercury lyase
MSQEVKQMVTKDKINLDDVLMTTLAAFPPLGDIEQRLSIELYRQLAQGRPVPRTTLARCLGIPFETMSGILAGWPGVFSDPEQAIVGYWGLALPTAYKSPHRFTVEGRILSAWCAWDTLFLPQLLGKPAAVESVSPVDSATIHLTVTPERVERVEPMGTQMSFLLPDAARVQTDVISTFCHFLHFFASQQAGETWAEKHPGTFLLSIEEAFLLGRRKNAAQYGDVLR